MHPFLQTYSGNRELRKQTFPKIALEGSRMFWTSREYFNEIAVCLSLSVNSDYGGWPEVQYNIC